MATGLATRCPQCHTVFRVVIDQLRVSEGWVRCGRCAEVFNAGQALMDLETGRPRTLPEDMTAPRRPRAPQPPAPEPPAPSPPSTPSPPSPSQASPAADTWRPEPEPDAAGGAGQADVDLPLNIDPAPASTAAEQAAAAEYEALIERSGAWTRAPHREPERRGAAPRDEPEMPTVDDSASRFPADALDEPGMPTAAQHAQDASTAGATSGGAAAPAARTTGPRTEPALDAPASGSLEGRSVAPRAEAAPAKPAFLRKAEAEERWSRAPVRATLVLVAAAASLVLVSQVLLAYRDLAAARFPALRPALAAVCGALGCTVGAARSIQGLTVESSGLVQVERSRLYKLNVGLRNRSGIELELPALELSLTDGQGRLLARRVLRTPELGLAQGTLAPGRDLLLQATLEAATPEPVAGYTIELFYP